MSTALQSAERIAREFHDTYERMAPGFGYQTRFPSYSWEMVPENNRDLMIAVVRALISRHIIEPGRRHR